MKKCPYCNIEVGGKPVRCPLCQSRLSGEGEAEYFPVQKELKLQSFFYKLQLFIVWTIVIVSIGLDFLFDLRFFSRPALHWSLLVAIWLINFEFTVLNLFKRGTGSAGITTRFVSVVLILLMITAYFIGQIRFMIVWVVPIALMAMLVTDFVFAMTDKNGNSMVYLLMNLFIGILPYIAFHTFQRNCPVTWIICLMASIILFVGAVIFKGREVASEIQKRLNM